MKIKRDVSLNLIFQLILMSLFPITIGWIQENKSSFRKSYISMLKTSESKP